MLSQFRQKVTSIKHMDIFTEVLIVMGTQKTIAKEIVDAEANYVLALKDNQGTFPKTVEDRFFITSLPGNCETFGKAVAATGE